MPDNTHVPDKLEGYMLQVRHALYELISLDERIVSVEAYDDVAVEKEGLLIAEQTKSVLSNNNPVTDRAEAFGKQFITGAIILLMGNILIRLF